MLAVSSIIATIMMMAYLEISHGILLYTHLQMISIARQNLCSPSLPWNK